MTPWGRSILAWSLTSCGRFDSGRRIVQRVGQPSPQDDRRPTASIDASVALLPINSSLSLTGCTLITGGGGTGGQGGTGQDGQPGGLGASGDSDGGNGGSGAGGSGGTGGTGGLSSAVVFQGAAPPTVQSCTFVVADPGHGGAGGPPGVGMALEEGVARPSPGPACQARPGSTNARSMARASCASKPLCKSFDPLRGARARVPPPTLWLYALGAARRSHAR